MQILHYGKLRLEHHCHSWFNRGDKVSNATSLNELNMKIYYLSRNVISCEEAAREKHIPLKNELKSMVLTTSDGLAVIHIPGDKMVDLRKIKRFLAVREAYLASKEILTQLGIQPGTVSPLVDNIWNLKQLISKEIMSLSFVSTNTGDLNRYVIFHPKTLLLNPNIEIGEFSK
jgi:prolyl-tRNA editing enzyme YbaK/EbsC (Cys-tRNA(Pro) deacylase)